MSTRWLSRTIENAMLTTLSTSYAPQSGTINSFPIILFDYSWSFSFLAHFCTVMADSSWGARTGPVAVPFHTFSGNQLRN
jgi:hypothetical protein